MKYDFEVYYVVIYSKRVNVNVVHNYKKNQHTERRKSVQMIIIDTISDCKSYTSLVIGSLQIKVVVWTRFDSK